MAYEPIRTKAQRAERNDRKAAERRATIAVAGLKAWRMPSQTIPDRRKAASKAACRGRIIFD